MSEYFMHKLELEAFEKEHSILSARFLSEGLLYNGELQ